MFLGEFLEDECLAHFRKLLMEPPSLSVELFALFQQFLVIVRKSLCSIHRLSPNAVHHLRQRTGNGKARAGERIAATRHD
jgi:hypothetical protein